MSKGDVYDGWQQEIKHWNWTKIDSRECNTGNCFIRQGGHACMLRRQRIHLSYGRCEWIDIMLCVTRCMKTASNPHSITALLKYLILYCLNVFFSFKLQINRWKVRTISCELSAVNEKYRCAIILQGYYCLPSLVLFKFKLKSIEKWVNGLLYIMWTWNRIN